jgi:hypothetical protein
MKLTLENKVTLMNNCLQFLEELNYLNIYYKDLKLDNIGYDEHFNYIVLDYDESTLFEEREIPRFFNHAFYHMSNTYPPLYFVHMNAEIMEGKRKIEERPYNKLHLLGLANLFILFFYNHAAIVNEMYEFARPIKGDWDNWKDRYEFFRRTIDNIVLKMDKQDVTIAIPERNKRMLKDLIKSLIKPKNFNSKIRETSDNEYSNTDSIVHIQGLFKLIFKDKIGKTKYLKMKEKYLELKNKVYSI